MHYRGYIHDKRITFDAFHDNIKNFYDVISVFNIDYEGYLRSIESKSNVVMLNSQKNNRFSSSHDYAYEQNCYISMNMNPSDYPNWKDDIEKLCGKLTEVKNNPCVKTYNNLYNVLFKQNGGLAYRKQGKGLFHYHRDYKNDNSSSLGLDFLMDMYILKIQLCVRLTLEPFIVNAIDIVYQKKTEDRSWWSHRHNYKDGSLKKIADNALKTTVLGNDTGTRAVVTAYIKKHLSYFSDDKEKPDRYRFLKLEEKIVKAGIIALMPQLIPTRIVNGYIRKSDNIKHVPTDIVGLIYNFYNSNNLSKSNFSVFNRSPYSLLSDIAGYWDLKQHFGTNHLKHVKKMVDGLFKRTEKDGMSLST